MLQLGGVWHCCRRGSSNFCGSLTKVLVSVLGSLVSDQAQHASNDVADDQFLGLCGDEAQSDLLHLLQQRFDVVPFRLGHDLKENVCGRDSAELGALDLSSFQETGGFKD